MRKPHSDFRTNTQPQRAQMPVAPNHISSDQLLGAHGELVILHGGRQYKLRVTQNGKLILTA